VLFFKLKNAEEQRSEKMTTFLERSDITSNAKDVIAFVKYLKFLSVCQQDF